MTTFTRSIVAVAAVLFLATPALAGPPLICFPFQTEGGKLLAWGTGQGWNTPEGKAAIDYALQNIAQRVPTKDVLAVLKRRAKR